MGNETAEEYSEAYELVEAGIEDDKIYGRDTLSGIIKNVEDKTGLFLAKVMINGVVFDYRKGEYAHKGSDIKEALLPYLLSFLDKNDENIIHEDAVEGIESGIEEVVEGAVGLELIDVNVAEGVDTAGDIDFNYFNQFNRLSHIILASAGNKYKEHMVNEDVYEKYERSQRFLTRDEEYELLLNKDNPKNVAMLVEKNVRLVKSVAKIYANRGVDREDLEQEGFIGLLYAIEKYDPEKINKDTGKPYRLSTTATLWIRSYAQLALLQANNIGSRSQVLQEKTKLYSRRQLFCQKQGREPDMDEIVKITGLTADRIEFLDNVPTSAISLDAPVREDRETSLMDLIEDSNTNNTSEKLIDKNLKQLFRKHVKPLFSERDFCILETRIFGRYDERIGEYDGEDYTLVEIGRKFGITRQRVEQIQAKVEKKVAEKIRNGQLRLL